MAVSMTGFGSGQASKNNWKCTTEIRTVNNRFLDTNIHIPTGFQHLTPPLKQIIKKTCHRGKVDCSITLNVEDTENQELKLNHNLALNYKTVLEDFQKITQVPVNVSLYDLLKIQDLVQMPQLDTQSDFFSSLIEASLNDALEQLVEMRSKEGSELLEDIQSRLEINESIINQIEKMASDLPKQYYEKLQERISALDQSLEFDEERLYKELTLYADRCDITEEIIRFRTHLKHMKSVLEGEEVGRRADFLLQEFNREINTIASKSNNASISQFVVEVKGQLEKIREQIQNIE